MKVFEYSLIESDKREELVSAVNTAMLEGHWLPAGGVAVWAEVNPSPDVALNDQRKTWYAQSMIRQVEVPDAPGAPGGH